MFDPSDGLVCHGPENLKASCIGVADALLQDRDCIQLGMFVRVKSGLHARTRSLMSATAMFTSLLRQRFPGEAFLTMALLRDPHFAPHKDLQNEWLPNLVVELRQSNGGGTWVECESGNLAVELANGEFRWGVVMTGAYKFSARGLLHCSMPGATPRVALVAWTPAGWQSASRHLLQELGDLGFVIPTLNQCARARLSIWSEKAMVQSTLAFHAPPHVPNNHRGMWPEGTLCQDRKGYNTSLTPHTSCLESEDSGVMVEEVN